MEATHDPSRILWGKLIVEQKDALQRIGRNLVNFQRLEHLLRDLLPTLRVKGASGSDVQQAIEKRRKEIHKKGLGDLSQSFHSTVFSASPNVDRDNDPKSPSFSIEFQIDAPEEHIHTTKKKWRRLVEERNKLVHSQLLRVDFEKPEDCAELCSRLDAQNAEVCSMLDQLAMLHRCRSKFATELEHRFNDGKLFESDVTKA